MNREQRRAINKIAKNDEASSSIDLMLKIAEQCLTCNKPYDKMSKEMAKTWFVEVYKADKKVNLYCPDCFKGKQENGTKS